VFTRKKTVLPDAKTELYPYGTDNKPSPDGFIIAFDLHDVLMHPKTWGMVEMVVLSKRGWQFIWVVLTHPKIAWDFVRLYVACLPWGLVTEQAFFTLEEQNSSMTPFKSWFVDLANHFEPDRDTLRTLEALKRKKYKLALFSNIGGELFKDMERKHKELFAFFDVRVTTEKESGYLRKPNPRAYERFWKKVNPNQDKCVVFVDDSYKNLLAAGKHHPNFFGFHFSNGTDLYDSFLRWGFF